ncbi:MAG: EF-hand domain-containing protein [Planctomycetota bacterium]|nr:EF-hand domain-containing protein [Planctomycetota bacterium]MDP7252136.1 EF-hand domain-containing protein [Planctomycetota bacterium]
MGDSRVFADEGGPRKGPRDTGGPSPEAAEGGRRDAPEGGAEGVKRRKLERRFRTYDKNSDGKVSGSEWLSMFEGSSKNAERRERVKTWGRKADRNRNGSISFAEFRWWEEVGKGQPEGRPSEEGGGAARKGLRDGEGERSGPRDEEGISREGLRDGKGERSGPRDGEGGSERPVKSKKSKVGRIYHFYDKSGDGKVVFSEWEKTKNYRLTPAQRERERKWFNRADRNSDGGVTFEEFKWWMEVGKRMPEGEGKGPRDTGRSKE